MDLPYLSTLYGVPETELQTLVDAPTAELVQEFLASLTTKSQEFDTLKADKVRVEVELENTVRTADAKNKAQKAQVTKHAKEAEELRIKLDEAESARESLASELEQLRSSTTGSTAETQTLRQRIETLEASNRDTLSLVESKSTEKDRLATELSEQHGKLLTLRREISQLEERNQSLENAASSQKYKEQSLHQEIDLLKRNNEWHSNELQTRSQEQAKFRKERNARIASLQRELEDANANVDTLKRTETNLRQRLESLQAKADEAFAKIAGLQEEAARKEQDFRTELDAAKRLADLQAQNAATHKARLQEVHGQIDQIKEDAGDEIGRLQAEIETERSDKEHAEAKVAELELTVERMEQQPRASRQGTPMRNGTQGPATPARLGSRAGSPNAMSNSLRKTVGGLSFTQLYSNYTEVSQELEAERRRTQKLSTAMDELCTELENRSPEILELRSEQERLEAEVLDFSRLLDEAKETRERLVKESDTWQGAAEAKGREAEILRQQLRDLSAQVKILLVEIQSRDQGLDDLSMAERIELERIARGELDEAALERLTSTGRFIQERLVLFRNVSELQEKNQMMLRLTENLGDRLEGEEAQAKARQNVALGQEKEQLEQQVRKLQDELQATVTQIDSYVKERDMFRRMLQHRGVLAPGADLEAMFGQSVPPATPQRNGPVDPAQTPRSKDMDDLNKLVKEQQTFFDQYRNESATDRRTLKEQVDSLAREKGTLQSDVLRAKSQLDLAAQRHEMLQSNYSALRNENSELQKRSQQMSESAAKQDLRTQQVAEELVEARSMAESLRNENANGKAEKELWKRVESRLSDDNKNLMDERSRLQKLVTDLQNLQNERELADSETRRRLQTRTEALESELAETKRKLEQEAEEGRKAGLRREYEEGQSRTRIDDLVKSLGNVREELVAAKTTRDQLQARVEELKIDLRSVEEKVTALQPRPTPRAEPQQNGEGQTNGETNGELPAEQRLALEISELHRDLELARNELDSARQQVEQYRQIAQSTEDELAGFNETSDQYKEETDRQIAEKDARVTELQQKIDDLSAELNTSNTELSELRTKSDDHARTLNEQKSGFEAELSRLRDDADRYANDKKLYQEDLNTQAGIAQHAQQSYEDELLKHAEAAKSLQSVRKEYNELRTEVAGIRAECEAAKVSLERGEDSWSEQRERFERELEEMKRRRQDVDQQNKLLHSQMEAFSTELAALRSGRQQPAGGEDGGAERAGTPSTGDSNLQEVIRFLRREKEIVDVQYELSIQEAKRLQQQLDYANSQLEDSRQKLADERREATEKTASEGSTNKLMQTINELNLFRESAVTLRNEARQARDKLEEKSREVELLVAETEPLKGRVGELEGELEGKDGELKLLQDDRDHWRERTQNIISKYDRVDPAELEDMKKQLEAAKADKERLETEQAPLREQVDGFAQRLVEAQDEIRLPFEERVAKFKDQAKDQNRKQNDKIRTITDQLNTAKAEKDQVSVELESTKTALKEAQASAGKGDGEEGEVHEDGAQGDEHASLHARIAEAEAQASGHASRAEALNGEVQTLHSRVQELEGQVAELQQQLETAQEGSQQTQAQPAADAETLEKLRQDLATAQQEAEKLKTNAVTAATQQQTTANAQPAEGEKSVADQVAEQVATLRSEMEQQHELVKTQMEEDRDKRIEKMRGNLQRQLRDEREKMKEEARQELIQQHSEELQKLKDEHEAAMSTLLEEHQAELARLKEQGGAAVQQAHDKIKPEANAITSTDALLELPDEQVVELLRSNQRVRTIFSNNIKKSVAIETEKLSTTIAEKDEEIATLKESQGSATTEAEKEALQQKLEAAEEDKKKAVAQALDTEQKKVKVQLNMRDILQAKYSYIQKAANETPARPVGEVWPEAQKAKPVPKTPAAGAAGSPAPKPPVPASPAHAQAPTQAQTPTQASPQTEPGNEQAKLQARAARFGTGSASPTQTPGTQATGTFGQPSVLSQPTPATFGTFGQPSEPNAARGSFGSPPNPQAPSFTPGGDASTQAPRSNSGLGPAAQRGVNSGIPRGGSNLPRGPAGAGRGGISIQGAASAQQSQPQRGGAQSGLPRGPSNANRGGRGGFGAASRGGGGPNSGDKRQHDGGGGGGDEKRMRGGGPSGNA